MDINRKRGIITIIIIFVILLSLVWVVFLRGTDVNYLNIFITVYGILLLLSAILFWIGFGHTFPPITTTVTIAVVILFLLLIFKIIPINIFFGGTEKEFRRNILDFIGVIFTGFIFAITIFWALMAGKVRVGSRTIYWQTYILVGLFFYICLSVCYILAFLKNYL